MRILMLLSTLAFAMKVNKIDNVYLSLFSLYFLCFLTQRTRGKGRNIIKKGRKVMRTKHAKIFILLFFEFFYIFWWSQIKQNQIVLIALDLPLLHLQSRKKNYHKEKSLKTVIISFFICILLYMVHSSGSQSRKNEQKKKGSKNTKTCTKSIGRNFLVFLEGILYPWISLLEKGRDIMPTPQGPGRTLSMPTSLLLKSGGFGILQLLAGVRSLTLLMNRQFFLQGWQVPHGICQSCSTQCEHGIYQSYGTQCSLGPTFPWTFPIWTIVVLERNQFSCKIKLC